LAGGRTGYIDERRKRASGKGIADGTWHEVITGFRSDQPVGYNESRLAVGGIMGLFDFFKRRPTPPTDLREALIDAASRQDWRTLAVLCEQHQQAIRDLFPKWRTLPESIRNDPAARDRYFQGILTVAQFFEQRGDRSLIALLIGDEATNPMLAWERDLSAAQSLIDDARPSDAAELLRSVLAKNARLEGSGVKPYLARTYGMLGVACFRTDDRRKAIEFTQKAKALCVELGDQEGVAVYTGNLRHIEEGATVVFRSADGRTLTAEELRGVTGNFRYEILPGTDVPPKANELHQQGRQAGGRGEYDKAVSLLLQAAELAPDWPYPVYDLAFTYLMTGDFDSATRWYRKTIKLSPRGFFTAITAVDALEREEQGDLPRGTYRACVSLEWISNPAEKAEAVRRFVERVPHFAPAWKELAMVLEDEDARANAIEKGLAANPDPETRGILLINKALAANKQGKRDDAIEMLGELALDPESTYGTEHLAKATLAMIAAK